MNVDCSQEAVQLAKDNKIQIKTSRVIYKLLESVEQLLEDYLHKDKVEIESKGQARVK